MIMDSRGFDCFNIPGQWYKGNLHTHTNRSDGIMPVNEVIKVYQENGYDFLAITDHNEYCNETLNSGNYNCGNMILIPGIEYGFFSEEFNSTWLYHIVALNIRSTMMLGNYGIHKPQYVLDGIKSSGGIAIIAHPYWSGNLSSSIMSLKDYTGIEVFNNCTKNIAKEYSEVHWDDLLNAGILKWGFAVDDFHGNGNNPCQGWIMVKSPERSLKSIMEAIDNGMFYSTTGIKIFDLSIDGDTVSVSFDRPCTVIFRGHSFHCGYSDINEVARNKMRTGSIDVFKAVYTLNGDERYLRIELIDGSGKKAYTNPVTLK